MIDEKEVQNVEKKALSEGLKIAKEKQRLAGECFKILKIAAIETNQKFNDDHIADKIYKEIKAVDNVKIKKLFELQGEEKKKSENKLLKKLLNNL